MDPYFNPLTIDFGFTQSSRQAFHDELGRFARLEGQFKLATMEQMRVLSEGLLEELKAQFIAGTAPGGDRTGNNLSLYQQAMGWVPTIQTFKISQDEGMWVRIVMGGAATWIESGTATHTIQPVNVDALHFFWQKNNDEEVWFKSVLHPGYRGDPFVERAVERIRLESYLARVAHATFVRLFAPYGTSFSQDFFQQDLYSAGTDPYGVPYSLPSGVVGE